MNISPVIRSLVGQGSVEWVIAPESADNAKEGGGLLITLSLGIPARKVDAITAASVELIEKTWSAAQKQPNTQTISLGSGHTEATVCIGKWVILDADDADSDMERAKWNSWMKTKEMELATMISDRFYTNPHYMQFLIFMLSRGIPASKADAITAASVKLMEKTCRANMKDC